MEQSSKIRILIADDHAILRAGLKLLLAAQEDMEVVGEAENGVQAIALTERLHPDIVLMDITMPQMGGLEATRILKGQHPQTQVLVLTMHDDREYLTPFLQAGASGYVLKSAADVDLIKAIHAAARGEIYLHSSMTKALIDEYLDQKAPSPSLSEEDNWDNLTERQREVLRLLAQGYTNQQVAEQLCVSVKTIETHRAHILEKLNLKSRADLIHYALRKGLLQQ